MPTLIPCITDASRWPDTITAVLTANFSNGGNSITGTATFTWHRVRLAQKVQAQKLPLLGLVDAGDSALPSVDAQEFLPVQSGIAQEPGWAVLIGDCDPNAGKGAFSQQYTPPPGSTGTPPPPTPMDVSCVLGMSCAASAPGRYFDAAGFPGVKDQDDGEVTVTLLRAGVAATPKTPALGNVYRIAFPVDGVFFGDVFSLIYNGSSVDMYYQPARGYITGLNNVYADSTIGFTRNGGASFCAAYPRSNSVVDVLMNTYGDTLAGGKFKYRSAAFFRVPDSTVLVQINGGNAVTIKLPDPFNLSVVSHTGNSSDPDDYCDIQIQF